jgi:hypothetical protein
LRQRGWARPSGYTVSALVHIVDATESCDMSRLEEIVKLAGWRDN